MKTIWLCFLLLLFSVPAFAGQPVIYHDGSKELEGYWAPSICGVKEAGELRPTVLIVHQWKGLGEYEKRRADMLATKCYNAFAVDMYGKGIRPDTTDKAAKESSIYKNDPVVARKRMTAALDYVRTLPMVDKNKIAVIGYCFGGAMALELARSGADIRGVVTFHGALATKDPVTKPGIIKASIQVHHGAEDPFVTQNELHNFIQEMKAGDADWSVTQYAHAVHSFTEKEAGDDPSTGAAYNEKADIRSWAAAMNFLEEIFSNPAQ